MVREREMVFGAALPGLSISGLYRTTQSPPPVRPEGRGELIDLDVAPGGCLFALHRFEPGAEIGMHYTDTMDFDTVLSGSVELILDDGPHVLTVGDCVVVTGVDHGWRAGSDGCVLTAVNLGRGPRT